MYICMHTQIHTHTHKYIQHTNTYTLTHTHTHTHNSVVTMSDLLEGINGCLLTL